MSEYLIPVGERDVERMDAMCQVFNSFSLELLSKYPAKTVLDVGCGNGGLTKAYARAHPEINIIGMDSSKDQLDVAQRNLPENIMLILGDVRNLPNNMGQFDLVHSRFVLTHLEDPVKVAEELLKLVKPGGVLIMEEAAGGIVNFSKEHRAAQAWVKAFQTQHILQKSTLHTAELLVKRFPQAKVFPCVGKFDTPQKKLVMLEGVKMSVSILPKIKIPDELNPMVTFNYTGEDWIRDSEELINDPEFTFEMNPKAIVVQASI